MKSSLSEAEGGFGSGVAGSSMLVESDATTSQVLTIDLAEAGNLNRVKRPQSRVGRVFGIFAYISSAPCRQMARLSLQEKKPNIKMELVHDNSSTFDYYTSTWKRKGTKTKPQSKDSRTSVKEVFRQTFSRFTSVKRGAKQAYHLDVIGVGKGGNKNARKESAGLLELPNGIPAAKMNEAFQQPVSVETKFIPGENALKGERPRKNSDPIFDNAKSPDGFNPSKLALDDDHITSVLKSSKLPRTIKGSKTKLKNFENGSLLFKSGKGSLPKGYESVLQSARHANAQKRNRRISSGSIEV